MLLEAGTRITTGVIVDRVAERLTPGIPPVKRREDNPNALIYDTVTKELAYMTGQDQARRRREPSPLPPVDRPGPPRGLLGQPGGPQAGPAAHA